MLGTGVDIGSTATKIAVLAKAAGAHHQHVHRVHRIGSHIVCKPWWPRKNIANGIIDPVVERVATWKAVRRRAAPGAPHLHAAAPQALFAWL